MGRLRAEPVRHRLGYVAEAVELGAEEVEVEASRTLCGTLDWLELYEEIAALKEVPSTLSLSSLCHLPLSSFWTITATAQRQ